MACFTLTISLHVMHLALQEREIGAAPENCIIGIQMAEAGILLMAEDRSKIRGALANITVCFYTQKPGVSVHDTEITRCLCMRPAWV